MTLALHQRRILLIISGGIAAYKSLDLIRRLREQGASVRGLLTSGGAKFITPLSVAALTEQPVAEDLWSLTDEAQMGHIRLSREADLILIAPASADLIAKMAHGRADDLASTVLLAANKPILIAPAMNQMMWANPATQDNVKLIESRGVRRIGPGTGDMACGEVGDGRMTEVADILKAVTSFFAQPGPLAGKRALVTGGPTYEPLDPVRFIGNRSSGKQGHALAIALQQAGAETILVTGPTQLPDPAGVQTIHIETAQQMFAACEAALPADIAILSAAVADWRAAEVAEGKIKKSNEAPQLHLVENVDILASLSKPSNRRPALVVGFAAETSDLMSHASAKLVRKGCDWLVANEVGAGKAFDQEDNTVSLLKRAANGEISSQNWPKQSKSDIARQLVAEIGAHLKAS